MSRPFARLTRAGLLATIPAMLAFGAMTLPAPAAAQIGIEITATVAPPPLFEYDQPPLPAPGYLWTPGYWAFDQDSGYYWVPGTWVEPPQVGLLWTPGYWGFNAGRYVFNAGYWGPTVGFYGGINYGFGYGGFGYEGGLWRGGVFSYNRVVNNFGGVHITNVYEKQVTNVTINRYSFNGPGGIDRRPAPVELAAMHERHIAPTPLQVEHRTLAARDPQLRAAVNHGRPAIAATPRPAAFPNAGHAVAPAGRPAETRPGVVRPAAEPGTRAASPASSGARPEENHAQPGAAATPRPLSRPTTTHHIARPATEPHSAMAPRPVAPRPEARPVVRPETRPEMHAPAAPRPAPRPMPRPEARPPAPHVTPPAPHVAPAHPAPHDPKKDPK